MTVSSQTNNVTFVGNGVTTAFPLPFRFFSNGDIRAFNIDSTTGASTLLSIGVDYTLTGAGEPEVDGSALSTITLAAPLPSLVGLYVERVMPQVQETDIVNQGEFFASTHEDVFDRLTMLIQQADASGRGAIRVAIGDPEPTRLAPAVSRANQLMGFDSQGDPIAVAPVSGDASDLALSLASDTDPDKGAGQVGYDQALAYPEGTLGEAVQAIEVLAANELSILQYEGLSVGGTRWDIALQAAIDAVEAIALTTSRPYGLPRIKIPGGVYSMGASVSTFPWIQICSIGSVVFDWSAAPSGTHGIICNNDTTLAEDSLKYPANDSFFLDGSQGTIVLKGEGHLTSTGTAMKLGNFSAGKKPFRLAKMRNVVISGWAAAQEFGAFDTYLWHCEDCRFEQSVVSIKTASGVSVNSGERMEWISCTFAGSDAVLDHNIDAFDANFLSCSFDFNTDVVKFGASSKFCAVRFDQPHIEAVGGLIVNGDAITGTVEGSQVSVFLTDSILLPRDRSGGAGVNSPSRKLFSGKFSLSMPNVKFRYESRPYLEDSVAIGSDVQVISSGGYHVPPFRGPVRSDSYINADWDFQYNAAGTSGDSLTYWERIVGATIGTVGRDIFDLAGKKVLRLAATTGTDTSAIYFRSKLKTPAAAGDVIWSNACLNINSATGAVQTLVHIEFFNDLDVSLGTFPAFSSYNVRDAVNDTTLPNYSEGNDRWMTTSAFRAVAPKNTAYAKMRFAVTAFDGTLYFSRARMWKD